MFALFSDFKFRKKLNTFANLLQVATAGEQQRSGSTEVYMQHWNPCCE